MYLVLENLNSLLRNMSNPRGKIRMKEEGNVFKRWQFKFENSQSIQKPLFKPKNEMYKELSKSRIATNLQGGSGNRIIRDINVCSLYHSQPFFHTVSKKQVESVVQNISSWIEPLKVLPDNEVSGLEVPKTHNFVDEIWGCSFRSSSSQKSYVCFP